MRLLVMFLCCLHITVRARNLKMVLRYHSHPSLIKYDMKNYCGHYIDLSGKGRNSGGVLSLEIPLKDIASNFSCTTALRAPLNYRVLVALKKMKIPIQGSSCSDYVMIFNGGLNSTDLLRNRICGYYDDNHSPRHVYYSRSTSSTLSIKISKQVHEDYNFDFGLTLTFSVFNRSQRGMCLSKEQMLCDNKFCIWKYFRCNGHNNCGDGSDEKQCGNDYPSTESPSSYKVRFPTALAAVLFVGILFIIIVTVVVIIWYRRDGICCVKLFPVAPGSRHRPARRRAATVTSIGGSSSRLETFGYDNNGFVPDPPPSYEESMDIQRQNERMSAPPDYLMACRALLPDQAVTERTNTAHNELPVWHQVLSIKL